MHSPHAYHNTNRFSMLWQSVALQQTSSYLHASAVPKKLLAGHLSTLLTLKILFFFLCGFPPPGSRRQPPHQPAGILLHRTAAQWNHTRTGSRRGSAEVRQWHSGSVPLVRLTTSRGKCSVRCSFRPRLNIKLVKHMLTTHC